MHALPELTEPQAQINQELVQLLITQIQTHGPMRFSEYMHRCLYEPGLGYYVNGLSKIGADGDFITAPELSADFAGCLARQSAEILAICGGDILEFGGGTGRLAVDCLTELDQLDAVPDRYYLLDVSADLQQSQKQLVTTELPARLADRVHWVNNFVDRFSGVVIANELFDAFPVEQFKINNAVAMAHSVGWDGNRFEFVPTEDRELSNFTQALQSTLPERFSDGYVSEYCPVLQPWWKCLSDSLDSAVVLVCDYGCERTTYYSRARSCGSLRCFFRHGVHGDALIYQGVQDITVDVDYTALAEAATSCGFDLEGYTSMAQFMLSLGALEHHEKEVNSLADVDRFKATGKLKQLLLPEEMGERFMVAGFSKNIGPVLKGFSNGDMSRLL